jgi:2,3-bisphosphoglycerate-independent phosphoglycerate mutase
METPRRAVLIILDGLGDRPILSLGGMTPLEAASTPNLDSLVAGGRCGLVDPGIADRPVSTHSGAGTLLGIDHDDIRRLARGPVEAAGIGLPMAEGDVAMRCNFATVERRDGALWVLDRRAGRVASETGELASELRELDVGDDVSATLYPATQHRAVLCLSGPGLSGAISNTDPGERARLPAAMLSSEPSARGDPAAEKTAAALNRFSARAFERLESHALNEARRARGKPPASGIICREAGMATSIPSLIGRIGLSAALVAGECTMLGLGRLLGYEVITDPRFSSLPDTDLDAKVEAVRAALASHDLVVLHIKGTDTCAHDQNPEGKRQFLEAIDEALAPLLGEDLAIAVTGDHGTDSNSGVHIYDPVPSLLYVAGGDADASETFGESQCAHGGLGQLSGSTFLASLLDAIGYRQSRSHEQPASAC